MTTKRRSAHENEEDLPSFIPVTDDEETQHAWESDHRKASPTGSRSTSPIRPFPVSAHATGIAASQQQQQQQAGKPRKPNRARVNTSPVPNSPLAPAPRFGPSAPNPNANWQNKKGTWLTNLVIIWTIRLMFAVIPGISKELSWTLTNCAYGLGHYVMFHWITGVPFETTSHNGEFDGLTMWEQMDDGAHFTPTKKFLAALPILTFLLSAHYTNYDMSYFAINLTITIVNCIAKLPSMHHVRLFGVNAIPDDDE